MKKNRSSEAQKPANSRPVSAVMTAYLIIIALFLFSYFFPSLRVWGVNTWAYHPLWLVGLLAIIAGSVAFYVYRVYGQSDQTETTEPAITSRPALWMGVIGILMTAGFLLLPSATHFLGDGYQLIDRMVTDAPFVKAWDFGASAINLFLYEQLGEGDYEVARQVFRILSFVSGLLALLVVGWFALRIEASNFQRLLLFGGLITGGYALQYFGYVENYALLITGILAYTLMGVEAVRGRLAVWWLLLPMALSLFVHLWGVALIPSFIYLAIRNTNFGKWIAAIPLGKKKLIALICFIVLVVIHQVLYYNYDFFTFAFLPLIPDRFVVDNDWLLSPKHLLDMLNLLLLMTPGVLLLCVLLKKFGGMQFLTKQPYPFLITLFVTALLMTYIFNPGIGMPRNWDLFSIVGPPLVVFCFLFFFDERIPRNVGLVAAILAVTLNILSLAPRVIGQANTEIGVAHFRNYLELDPVRSRNARRLLINHYNRTGDTAMARIEQEQAEQEHPESILGRKGRELMAQGKMNDAITVLHQAIEANPLYYDAWANIGSCYLHLGKLDSALILLEIADGLNPYNAQTLANIGTVHLRKKDMTNAEAYFTKALTSDSKQENALMGLAVIYVSQDQAAKSLEILKQLAAQSDLPAEYYVQAAKALIDKKAFYEAGVVLQFAIDKGLDSQVIMQIRNQYPQIQIDER